MNARVRVLFELNFDPKALENAKFLYEYKFGIQKVSLIFP